MVQEYLEGERGKLLGENFSVSYWRQSRGSSGLKFGLKLLILQFKVRPGGVYTLTLRIFLHSAVLLRIILHNGGWGFYFFEIHGAKSSLRGVVCVGAVVKLAYLRHVGGSL